MWFTGYMPPIFAYILFFLILSPLTAYLICRFSEERKKPRDEIKINSNRFIKLIVFFDLLSFFLFASLRMLMDFGYNSSTLHWNLFIAFYVVAAILIFTYRYERKYALAKFSIFYFILTCGLISFACVGTEHALNAQKSFYTEPLREAIASGNLNNVKQIINEGADVNKRFKADNETPLCIAAMGDSKQIIAFLIKSGASVNDASCMTLLMSYGKHENIIQILRSNNSVSLTDKTDAAKALRMAIDIDNPKVIVVLVKAGAPIKGWRDIDWEYTRNANAIAYARSSKRMNAIDALSPFFSSNRNR